jgi:hypothetical protein
MMRSVQLFLLLTSLASAADWKDLFNGKDLTGWQVVGDGIWTVQKDGTLIGQRNPSSDPLGGKWPLEKKPFQRWWNAQSWLYTNEEFYEFDLQLDYWLPVGANSGVSIRDTSRARYSFGVEDDPTRTPSHIGYEIQLINSWPGEKYPSGSIYNFVPAKRGYEHPSDWNHIEIQSREKLIRVLLNGTVVAESPGDPARPKRGPIGLQLHDQKTFAMFRNIRIRVK